MLPSSSFRDQQHSTPTGVSAAGYRQFHTSGCCSGLAYCMDIKAWTTILAASSVMDLTTDRIVEAGNVRTGTSTTHGLPSTTGYRRRVDL